MRSTEAGGRAVRLENEGHYPGLGLVALRQWLEGVLEELAAEADSFGVCLTSDRRIRALNREYRGIDSVTDVLSFEGDETPEGLHLGDVVLSIPTARRQARAQGHGLHRELRELLLHGILHCLGMDHESDDGEMDRRELELRRRFVPEDLP